MKFRENEDAVSPVIGVILMVAITVILAAVIAAFVFGMGSNVGTTKTVSITSQIVNEKLVFTINGGPYLPTLKELTITVNGNNTIITGPGSGSKFKVGETIKLTNTTEGRVLIIGKWRDGAEQIIFDRTF